MGFSTEKSSNWDGLYIQDPFNLAEALVTVAVDGVSSTDYLKGHNFPLRTDEEADNIYEELVQRIGERYPENNNQFVRINLENGLEDVSLLYL